MGGRCRIREEFKKVLNFNKTRAPRKRNKSVSRQELEAGRSLADARVLLENEAN